MPDGADLNRHRKAIVDGLARVREIAATGDYQAARQAADDLADKIAEAMSDDERAVDAPIPESKQESVADIGARMYEHR